MGILGKLVFPKKKTKSAFSIFVSQYILCSLKGRQREEKIVIIALLDNFRYLGKLLSSFENYYCNIRVASEFIIFTDQKDIKKFRSEVYSKAIDVSFI